MKQQQQKTAGEAVVRPILNRDAVSRLLVNLVEAEQAKLIHKGIVSTEKAVCQQVCSSLQGSLDDLSVDEASLGFDSLSRLDLIMRVSEFFNLHSSGVEDHLLINRTLGAWVSLIEEHIRLSNKRFVIGFSSSGSTGSATVSQHSVRTLLSEIGSIKSQIMQRPDTVGRILSLVPCRHIYGFIFSCLLPSQTHRCVVDLSRQNPLSVFAVAQPGDIVVATPNTWRRLSTTKRRFADDVTGITSAGPSDNAVWAITETCKLRKLHEIYGSTETAGIGHRDDIAKNFELFSHLVRQGDQIHHHGQKSPLDIQDKLTWMGNIQFRLDGRCDDVVQVSGVNVSPAFVEAQIKKFPDVSDVAVRFEKERLKAFVVVGQADTDVIAVRRKLFAYLQQTLEAPARPDSITIGNAVPRNAMGKVADWQAA